MTPPHITKVRVRYADTDQMGVAYYANYFIWFEEARTEYFRAKGYPYTQVEENGVYLPVIEASCIYKAPARYDDLLEIHTIIADYGRTSLTFQYQVFNNAQLNAEGKTTHVFINQEGKPLAIPKEVKKILPLLRYETP